MLSLILGDLAQGFRVQKRRKEEKRKRETGKSSVRGAIESLIWKGDGSDHRDPFPKI